jgi:hypothetical protein
VAVEKLLPKKSAEIKLRKDALAYGLRKIEENGLFQHPRGYTTHLNGGAKATFSMIMVVRAVRR